MTESPTRVENENEKGSRRVQGLTQKYTTIQGVPKEMQHRDLIIYMHKY